MRLGVKLGLPVAILFALGECLYRRHLCGGEVRACPAEVRHTCPAFHRPEVPCCQAAKEASGGHIDTRCFACSLLLSY